MTSGIAPTSTRKDVSSSDRDPAPAPAHLPFDILPTQLVEGLRNVVGDAHLMLQDRTDNFYNATTGPRRTYASAVVRPADAGQVREVLRLARAEGVGVYPISRGRNWGYGDAAPVQPGHIVIDLGRMNRIIEVNDDLAYAVIEPGVSQGQLYEYLRANHPELWMDATGAGPDVSVVGNILERGFGHTPNGNRFQNISGMEIVLADGRLLNTGLGHYETSRAAQTYPYGVGPFLDGLFTQSNFGVVTRMGVWLVPKPDTTTLFIATSDDDDGLSGLIEAIRPLRLDGTIRSVVHIGNDMRLISSGAPFPADLFDRQSTLPAELRETIRTSNGIAKWTAVGTLYGDKRQVAASLRRVRRALKGHRLMVLTEARLNTAKALARFLPSAALRRKMAAKLATATDLFDLNRGVPTARFLSGAYWRRRGGLPENFPANTNPAVDGCAFYWLSPVLPATAADATALNGLVEPILKDHGFDFAVTYSLVNERSLAAVISIAYDRDNEEEARRARACYDAMFRAAVDAGYIPYRVAPVSMPDLADGSDGFWDVVADIKRAVDPDNIVAPGRYQP